MCEGRERKARCRGGDGRSLVDWLWTARYHQPWAFGIGHHDRYGPSPILQSQSTSVQRWSATELREHINSYDETLAIPPSHARTGPLEAVRWVIRVGMREIGNECNGSLFLLCCRRLPFLFGSEKRCFSRGFATLATGTDLLNSTRSSSGAHHLQSK